MSGQKMFPLQTSRNAPPGPRVIPWSVAEIAYGEYSRRYGSSQSLERLAERGGFGWCEMDEFYPQWRQDVSEITALRAENAALRADGELLSGYVEVARQAIIDANPLVFGADGTIDHEKPLPELAMLAAEKIVHLRKLFTDVTAIAERREIENAKLRAALVTIGQWDCLNPPATHLCADLSWLRQIVDAALALEAAR